MGAMVSNIAGAFPHLAAAAAAAAGPAGGGPHAPHGGLPQGPGAAADVAGPAGERGGLLARPLPAACCCSLRSARRVGT
jgi:hypothetical protein